eukprot:scaffold13.g410.t1
MVRRRLVHAPSSLPSDDLLKLVHAAEFVDAFNTGTLDAQRMRRIGFGEVTRQQLLIDRTKAEVAGTLLTAELALRHGLAVNTAGGTHHAFRDTGAGFCIMNDMAIAAEALLAAGSVRRVLILDLDVHQVGWAGWRDDGSNVRQVGWAGWGGTDLRTPAPAPAQGDGTAAIFQGREDVFTLSVHAESNFPARKQASHVDIGLLDGTGDQEYLGVVAEVLTGALGSFRPDLVIYDAGVDPHEVLDTCIGSGVPVAGLVGGGYHADLEVLAARHCWLHKAAVQLWQDHHL